MGAAVVAPYEPDPLALEPADPRVALAPAPLPQLVNGVAHFF